MLARDGQSYVSVYDSDNAKLDSGELKDLALAASKALKTAAVFTSLYDSDTYEFIVFADGRQVDLLMTDAESYDGPMKQLSEKSRAAKWSSLFGRTLSIDQIRQVVTKQTALADDIVGGLSELIGLRDGQPQMNYQDFLDEGEAAQRRVLLQEKAQCAVRYSGRRNSAGRLFRSRQLPHARRLSVELATGYRRQAPGDVADIEPGRGLQRRNGDRSAFRSGHACTYKSYYQWLQIP